MAGKAKTVYVCSDCGYESSKWYGSCPGCGEWNTMQEDVRVAVTAKNSKSSSSIGAAKAVPIKEISFADEVRYKTGMNELDRVLGGGLVKGSLVLLSGDPGIGKSTILLQICQHLGENHNILYVSGEESSRQIKIRADRLGVETDKLSVMSETDAEKIAEFIRSEKPDVVIIDSIQTMNISEISSSPYNRNYQSNRNVI